MDYRELWERLKVEIQSAIDEGRECGYDDPESENFDKFWVYTRVFAKMTNFENH